MFVKNMSTLKVSTVNSTKNSTKNIVNRETVPSLMTKTDFTMSDFQKDDFSSKRKSFSLGRRERRNASNNRRSSLQVRWFFHVR